MRRIWSVSAASLLCLCSAFADRVSDCAFDPQAKVTGDMGCYVRGHVYRVGTGACKVGSYQRFGHWL